MQTLIRSVIIFILIFITWSTIEVNAQPAFKAKERIRQMKKMKLLDILVLTEEEADKFIVKYNSWENKTEAQREEIDKISDELFEAIKNEAKDDEFQKLSAKLLSAQEKFFSIQMEKFKAMRDILSPANYAKYLVFEDRFIKELGKRMMQGRGKGDGKGSGRGHGRGMGNIDEMDGER